MQRIAHVHGARGRLANRRDADRDVAGRVARRKHEAELRCARRIDRAALALEQLKHPCRLQRDARGVCMRSEPKLSRDGPGSARRASQ